MQDCNDSGRTAEEINKNTAPQTLVICSSVPHYSKSADLAHCALQIVKQAKKWREKPDSMQVAQKESSTSGAADSHNPARALLLENPPFTSGTR
jgi:hypothetical protein